MVKIVNKSPHDQLTRGSNRAAGYDIRASLEAPVVLLPGKKALIRTGVFMELPANIEAQVRPRSGMAFKHGITVINTPGTIDEDYRGEVGVILINHSSAPFAIEDGMRIAQIIFNKVEHPNISEVEELSSTNRGEGGFGSTGKL